MTKSLAMAILGLVGLGLVLRFGGTSNTLLNTAGGIGHTTLNDLSLSRFPGNFPSAGVTSNF